MNSDIMITAIGEKLGEMGAELRRIDLHDLDYKGCSSCFACKREGKASYGRCAMNDDLKGVLEEIRKADGLFIASPIFFNDVSGEVRSFLERLMFQYTIYSNPVKTIIERPLKIGLVYSMNYSREAYEGSVLKEHLAGLESRMARALGMARSHFSFSTNQLNNYEGIEYTYFEPVERKRRYQENLPREIESVRSFTEEVVLA
jgi:multimeric flavodoxin WrbA